METICLPLQYCEAIESLQFDAKEEKISHTKQKVKPKQGKKDKENEKRTRKQTCIILPNYAVLIASKSSIYDGFDGTLWWWNTSL